jgi:hypothetical protein
MQSFRRRVNPNIEAEMINLKQNAQKEGRWEGRKRQVTDVSLVSTRSTIHQESDRQRSRWWQERRRERDRSEREPREGLVYIIEMDEQWGDIHTAALFNMLDETRVNLRCGISHGYRLYELVFPNSSSPSDRVFSDCHCDKERVLCVVSRWQSHKRRSMWDCCFVTCSVVDVVSLCFVIPPQRLQKKPMSLILLLNSSLFFAENRRTSHDITQRRKQKKLVCMSVTWVQSRVLDSQEQLDRRDTFSDKTR